MPSLTHEELVELFRSDPLLAVEVVRDACGVPLPTFDRVDVKPGDIVELIPISYRADVVVLLLRDKPVYALIVEVQLDRDSDKRLSWPLYVAAARARYRCPACLLVYAPDASIAAWCAKPIDLGQPGSLFLPLVRGPEVIPHITDPEEAAQHPFRAVFSAIAHGHTADGEAIGRAALEGVASFPEDERATWEEVILSSLDEAIRKALEAWMRLQGYPEKSRFYQQGKADGEARGEARALLTLLEARGLSVSTEARERILACADLNVLDGWIRRAVTIASVDELFAASS